MRRMFSKDDLARPRATLCLCVGHSWRATTAIGCWSAEIISKKCGVSCSLEIAPQRPPHFPQRSVSREAFMGKVDSRKAELLCPCQHVIRGVLH
jgi:hypothetical protein